MKPNENTLKITIL